MAVVIDFNEYVEKRQQERAKIEAEAKLAEARDNLANAYVTKGLAEIFARHGLELTVEDVDIFTPLMLQAIDAGLTARQIEEMILASISDAMYEEDLLDD